jgi:DNA repair protein RadC
MADEQSDGYQARIRDLPATDRPRERLRDAGPSALSNQELLAILLRTGSAKESALAQANRLLGRFHGLVGLARAGFAELCSERGLGEAKAAQVQAALELGKRLAAAQPEERAAIRSPEDVSNLMQGEMGLLDQEHLRVLLLNTRNQVLGTHEVYRGSVHTAVVRIGELFREALRQNAPCIILVHNHPSGDPTPSSEDISMTKQAIAAGELLDIDVLDHVIIAHARFASLKSMRVAFA